MDDDSDFILNEDEKDKKHNIILNESNSSSLNSYEEVKIINPNVEEVLKNNKRKSNILYNDKDDEWNNILKIRDTKVIDEENESITNSRRDSLVKTSFSNYLYNNKLSMEEDENEKKSFQIKGNKTSKHRTSSFKEKPIKTGETTPGLKNNSNFFKSQFGKFTSYIEKDRINDNNLKNSSKLLITNKNKKIRFSTTIRNYYASLKEINKLITYKNNSQQIFSKKTIKIIFNNDETNLNTKKTKSIIIQNKNSIKRNSIKKKGKKTITFKLDDGSLINNKDFPKNNLTEKDNNDENNSTIENNNLLEEEINIMELIIEIFRKPSNIRNRDELFFIEHYLMTFENVMKILQQKKIGSAGNDLAKKIARYMQIDIIPKNTLICKLGDEGDKFYVLFQGNVAILIPKETNVKMNINEYLNHLNKLFDLGEYELALKTIESNIHIFKNNDIIYMKSDLEKHLYLPEYMNYKRENLSIKDYMARIEPDNTNDNIDDIDNIILIEHNNQNNSLLYQNDSDNDELSYNFSNENFGSNHNNLKIAKRKTMHINNLKTRTTSFNLKNLTDFKRHESRKKTKFNIENKNSVHKPPKKKFTSILLSMSKKENIGSNQIGKSNKIFFNTLDSPSHKKNLEENRIKKSIFSSKNVLSQDIMISSPVHNSNKNNEENDKENAKNKRYNIILWSYFHVTNLIDGQTFGDVALSEDNKRRTASIITQEKTICGTLDYYIYNKFIKDAQKKLRKNIVHSLLQINFLKGINEDIFEEQYFNMFKYASFKRNDYMFKSGDKRNSIYIIISGEIELTITCTFQQLNKILSLKNVILDDAIKFEERLTVGNESFNYFYTKCRDRYHIKIHSAVSWVGLNEYVIPTEKIENLEGKENPEQKDIKDISYIDAKCISEKAEVYSIDYKLLSNLFKNEKKEKRLKKLMKESEKDNLLRIINIKKNVILERFWNLCDKNFFKYYLNIKNKSEESKNNFDYNILNSFSYEPNNKEKKNKKLNIVINDISSSLMKNIKKIKRIETLHSINKLKLIKPNHNNIQSNNTSKESKIIIDDILNEIDKEPTKETDKNNNKKKLSNNSLIKKNGNNNLSEKKKLKNLDESEDDFSDNSLNFQNSISNINNSNKKNKNIIYKYSEKQFSKSTKVKEIYFDERTLTLNNEKPKNNILNKKNKKIFLYPILSKKSKLNLKTISNSPKKKIKLKIFKKSLSQNKLNNSKEKVKHHKDRKSIFSLVLNGVPDFNNKYINKNINMNKISKKCDCFKNAKFIDKDMLKLPKEKLFFYKGCESLLTINNNNNNNDFIPIIDLLKYDKIYEKKCGFKKRNLSAVNKPPKNFYK